MEVSVLIVMVVRAGFFRFEDEDSVDMPPFAPSTTHIHDRMSMVHTIKKPCREAMTHG